MKIFFKIITFGCRANQYESEAFANQLSSIGHVDVKNNDFFDICIINGCSVTKSAENSVLKTIKNFKRKNPDAKFYITGCLSKEAKDILNKNLIVFENTKKEELVSHIFPETIIPKFMINCFSSHTRAFVKIQDGCDNFCTYCIIPHTRGRSRSRSYLDILEEIEILSKNGYKEVVLTGIDIGDYKSKDMTLAALIKEIDKIDRLKRLRLSSIEPEDVNDNLIDSIINSKKACNSLHLVLQSGSDKILKKMNRKYTSKIFLEKVYLLKKLDPSFTFTTDIIVGFPFEEEEDFQKTLNVVNRVKFAKVHVFGYSERPNTPAAKYTNKIDSKEIKRRKTILLEEGEKQAFIQRESFVGKKMQVLFESKTKDGYQSGHTLNFLNVIVKTKKNLKNNIFDVKITQNTKDYIIGEL